MVVSFFGVLSVVPVLLVLLPELLLSTSETTDFSSVLVDSLLLLLLFEVPFEVDFLRLPLVLRLTVSGKRSLLPVNC